MISKKGFEFSFAWIFAIIVGAVFIFLAIYAASNLIQSNRTYQDSKLGKELEIILNPLETGLETGKSSTIKMPSDTRIYNRCSNINTNFGSQEISISTKLSVGNEWQPPGIASDFSNKYLFSSDIAQGKNFNVFSKPILMPYKIADLIYIWSEDDYYCFVNPPNQIEDEVISLGLHNINITSDKCVNKINVCFTNSNCEIDVSLDMSGKIRGSLKKKFENRVFFSNQALLYAAILSSSDIYECNLKRLMKRTSELAHVYRSKSELLTAKGCGSSILIERLEDYSTITFSINNSKEIISIESLSDNLRRSNEALSCDLF